MFTFPLLLTIYAGFTHAFEADHLLAVSNIVSSRNSIRLSLKDGAFWGFGHTSTILVTGIVMIVFKSAIPPAYFNYFEAIVGLMLIVLAVYRLVKYFRPKNITVHSHIHHHSGSGHKHLHVHAGTTMHHRHPHLLAYGVGLIHGLAGSGALVVMVLSQIKAPADGMMYLFIFGAGSIAGMLLAAGLFSIPFSKKWMQARSLQLLLIIASCTLCLVYGGKVIYENLFA